MGSSEWWRWSGRFRGKLREPHFGGRERQQSHIIEDSQYRSPPPPLLSCFVILLFLVYISQLPPLPIRPSLSQNFSPCLTSHLRKTVALWCHYVRRRSMACRVRIGLGKRRDLSGPAIGLDAFLTSLDVDHVPSVRLTLCHVQYRPCL